MISPCLSGGLRRWSRGIAAIAVSFCVALSAPAVIAETREDNPATQTSPDDASSDPSSVPDGTGQQPSSESSTPLSTQNVSTAPLASGVDPNTVLGAVVPGTPAEPPSISAAGAVLYDPADHVLLNAVNPRTPLPMASTTKIMTVLVALEALEAGHVPNEVTVSAFAAETGRQPGVATLGLNEGDVVGLRAVLLADLLRSGNDGAVAIAEHIAGDETMFVTMMNQRARTLGLENTSFVDSSGLSNDIAHHATALDLALLGEEAMSHVDFAEWAGTTQLTVEPFGVLENRNELLRTYPGTTGIKTGYTERAGLCLVASAERDGRTLYAVVLGSEDRVADTTALFDYGFNNFDRPIVYESGVAVDTYQISTGAVPLSATSELARTFPAGAAVEVATQFHTTVERTIQPGTVLGETRLIVDGVEVDRTTLVATTESSTVATNPGGAIADVLRGFARIPERREHLVVDGFPSD